MWETLNVGAQARILNLLIDHIDYDGGEETIAITFHPTGLEAFTRELQPEMIPA